MDDRLVVLNSPQPWAQSPTEWRLGTTELTIGRRDGERVPDVALADQSVSRRHCVVVREGATFKVADAGSRYGTQLAGTEIQGKGQVVLCPGAVLSVGRTELMIAPPNWHRVHCEGVVVDFQYSPYANYALAHCGIPFVLNAVVRNWGPQSTRGGELQFVLGDVARSELVELPPLARNAACALRPPRWRFAGDLMEAVGEPKMVPLRVDLGGCPGDERGIGVWLLPPTEWCQDVACRIALATFVQPDNLAVSAIVAGLIDPDDARGDQQHVRDLYCHLTEQFGLFYSDPPPSDHKGSQRLRLPDRILGEQQGTCLDLGILVASCLERLGFQPLLILVDTGNHMQHCLIGWWTSPGGRIEPVIDNADRVLGWLGLGTFEVLEPTGIARTPSRNTLDFPEAVAAARECLHTHPVLCLVDVKAARHHGITPLPLPVRPQFGPAARRAVDSAQRRGSGSPTRQVRTLDLLAALVANPNSPASVILAELTGDADRCRERLPVPPHRDPPPHPPERSTHYEMALSTALHVAGASGRFFVEESHLLCGVLVVPSAQTENLLRELGTTPEECLDKLAEMYGIPVVESHLDDSESLAA